MPIRAESNESSTADATPLVLEAAYTGDLWRNVHGGARRDGTYLDNIDLIATLDADLAFSWTGTTFLVSGLYNNHSTLSDRIVGDIQTVSNIDTDGAPRLYEAWVERTFSAGAAKASLIDLNSELDVNETGALFVNSSHGIGPDFSQIGENGPAIHCIQARRVVPFSAPGVTAGDPPISPIPRCSGERVRWASMRCVARPGLLTGMSAC